MPESSSGDRPTPSPEISAENRERVEKLEVLAKIVQAHPEVLDVPFTPQMIAAFAQHLETPSGEVFVAIREKEGVLYNPGRWMQLFGEKPKGILIMEDSKIYKDSEDYKGEPANPIAEYSIRGRQGYGGLDTLPDAVAPALKDLIEKMDLLSKEEIRGATMKDRLGGIQAQTFLYTFRRRETK